MAKQARQRKTRSAKEPVEEKAAHYSRQRGVDDGRNPVRVKFFEDIDPVLASQLITALETGQVLRVNSLPYELLPAALLLSCTAAADGYEIVDDSEALVEATREALHLYVNGRAVIPNNYHGHASGACICAAAGCQWAPTAHEALYMRAVWGGLLAAG